MTRCEDLLAIVNSLEKSLVGDPYCELLMPHVQASKEKVTNLLTLLEEQRPLGDAWVVQFEESLSPMLDFLSGQLKQLVQKSSLRSFNSLSNTGIVGNA